MKTSFLAKILIGGSVLIFSVFILLRKEGQKPAQPLISSALPEVQLERAMSAGKPALAFFHSNNCEQCLIMIDTVRKVYPEFTGLIELVDVDVYDAHNERLLRSARIQLIPTLVFYDRSGNSETHVGVLKAGELRSRLQGLSGAK